MLTHRPWQELYTIKVSNESGTVQYDIAEIVTAVAVSYTMDMASQLSFTVVDKDWAFSKANWFMLRRIVRLTEIATRKVQIFEIAAINYEAGDAFNLPRIGVECRTRAIQMMKRDKRNEAFKAMSATEFAQIIALRHGLKIYGESVNKIQTIVKSKSSNSDESVWDMLRRLASDHQFVVFESSGTLFFCTERFLLGKLGTGTDVGVQLATRPGWPGTTSIIDSGDQGEAVELLQFYLNVPVTGTYGADLVAAVKTFQRAKGLPVTGNVDIITWNKLFGTLGQNWNYVPMVYPPTDTRFMVLNHPTVRKSDDDPYEAQGDLLLERTNAVQLRPGMTIGLNTPNPHINGAYLITSVEYELGGPDPVKVSFRTPAPLDPANTTSTSQ